MKAYERYNTLHRLVDDKSLGWAQTNEYGKAAKGHFLQMRKEGLVDYTYGDDNKRIKDLIIKGPDKNAYFYTITPKGLLLLAKLFPESEEVFNAMRDFVEGVLSEDPYWIKEFEYRNKK